MTWTSDSTIVQSHNGLMGWVRVVRRGVPVVVLVGVGLVLTLLLRLIEAPIFGARRPITPHITQFVCRNGFRLLGIAYTTQGSILKGQGAVVANHSSWLDIFALNASKRIYFVAKSEVASWPGIGWLARATGTVFIKRNPREAAGQVALFRLRLSAGHKLLFFPEGTSTDGLQVLPFKATLFAAFFDDHLRKDLQIQPVTVAYDAPTGADPRFYGWWGDMGLAGHLITTLSIKRQGRVTVIYHTPVFVREFNNRKSLAAHLEQQVRAGLKDHRRT